MILYVSEASEARRVGGGWRHTAGEKRQTCWPKPHTETEYESQITTILYWIKLIPSLWKELLEVRWQSLAKITCFLCHCEIIKNNFIKIRSCSV